METTCSVNKRRSEKVRRTTNTRRRNHHHTAKSVDCRTIQRRVEPENGNDLKRTSSTEKKAEKTFEVRVEELKKSNS